MHSYISTKLGLSIIILIVVLYMLGIGGFFFDWSGGSSGEIGFNMFSHTKERVERLRMITPPLDEQVSDWNLYRNVSLGYQLKYPKEWQLNEKEGQIGMNAYELIPQHQVACSDMQLGSIVSCLDKAHFGVVENKQKLNAKSLIEKLYGKDYKDFEPVMIDKIKAYKFTLTSAFDGSDDNVYWIFLDRTHFFGITGSYLSDEELNLFDMLASTFQYTSSK